MLTDLLSNRSSVFANPAGKHQSIQPTERRSQRAEFASDPVDEQLDGFYCMWIIARQQRAHVAAYARYPQQPGAVIQQIGDGNAIHSFLDHQVKHYAGIEGAAAMAHREAIEGGES